MKLFKFIHALLLACVLAFGLFGQSPNRPPEKPKPTPPPQIPAPSPKNPRPDKPKKPGEDLQSQFFVDGTEPAKR
jgi:hypothetical protein